VIHASNVHMTFGDGALATPVLHAVDLVLRPGELTLLTGPSGSARAAAPSTSAATASRR
jgi:ABC-type lipoprotein export system ATPase subunit